MCLCHEGQDDMFFDYLLGQHIKFLKTFDDEDKKYYKSYMATRRRLFIANERKNKGRDDSC